MFRFSNDDFVANKQKEEATALLESLLKYFTIEHCPEIEKLFDDNVKTYEFLEELPRICEKHNGVIMMPCIPYNYNHEWARMNLSEPYQKLSYPWKGPAVPFIEFSFPEDYKCKHGENWKHVYILFLTKFPKFEDARDSIICYFNKLNNLKVFL